MARRLVGGMDVLSADMIEGWLDDVWMDDLIEKSIDGRAGEMDD